TSVSLEVLRHVSEEASHAFLLKAVAEGMCRSGPSETASTSFGREGLFSAAGWNYFQRLDQEVSALSDDVLTRYPAVSWAIERRVLAVYPQYRKITRSEEVKRVLTRILAQEERHGREFESHPFPEGLQADIVEIEAPLWATFRVELESLCVSNL